MVLWCGGFCLKRTLLHCKYSNVNFCCLLTSNKINNNKVVWHVVHLSLCVVCVSLLLFLFVLFCFLCVCFALHLQRTKERENQPNWVTWDN